MSKSVQTKMSDFEQLIQSIGDVLGSTSGLDSDGVNHDELVQLMQAYTSDESEWSQYAMSVPGKNYTRNQVSDINKKANVLVVVWVCHLYLMNAYTINSNQEPGKGSPIHDHAGAHCVMKMLKGQLKETLYDQPYHPAQDPVKVTTYEEGQVTYISDKIGLHKVENISNIDRAVSLHLYTPPHAHNYGFNIFDQATGKCFHTKSSTLYSDKSIICKKDMQARI